MEKSLPRDFGVKSCVLVSSVIFVSVMTASFILTYHFSGLFGGSGDAETANPSLFFA